MVDMMFSLKYVCHLNLLNSLSKMNLIRYMLKFNNQRKIKCLARSQHKPTSLMWELAIALVF